MSEKEPGSGDASGEKTEASAVTSYAGAGLQFAVALVAFVLAGDWLDKKFGTSPLFLLVGVFGGGAAAFYSMYRKLMAPHSQMPKKPEKR